jgi:hypothetical protein
MATDADTHISGTSALRHLEQAFTRNQGDISWAFSNYCRVERQPAIAIFNSSRQMESTRLFLITKGYHLTTYDELVNSNRLRSTNSAHDITDIDNEVIFTLSDLEISGIFFFGVVKGTAGRVVDWLRMNGWRAIYCDFEVTAKSALVDDKLLNIDRNMGYSRNIKYHAPTFPALISSIKRRVDILESFHELICGICLSVSFFSHPSIDYYHPKLVDRLNDLGIVAGFVSDIEPLFGWNLPYSSGVQSQIGEQPEKMWIAIWRMLIRYAINNDFKIDTHYDLPNSLARYSKYLKKGGRVRFWRKPTRAPSLFISDSAETKDDWSLVGYLPYSNGKYFCFKDDWFELEQFFKMLFDLFDDYDFDSDYEFMWDGSQAPKVDAWKNFRSRAGADEFQEAAMILAVNKWGDHLTIHAKGVPPHKKALALTSYIKRESHFWLMPWKGAFQIINNKTFRLDGSNGVIDAINVKYTSHAVSAEDEDKFFYNYYNAVSYAGWGLKSKNECMDSFLSGLTRNLVLVGYDSAIDDKIATMRNYQNYGVRFISTALARHTGLLPRETYLSRSLALSQISYTKPIFNSNIEGWIPASTKGLVIWEEVYRQMGDSAEMWCERMKVDVISQSSDAPSFVRKVESIMNEYEKLGRYYVNISGHLERLLVWASFQPFSMKRYLELIEGNELAQHRDPNFISKVKEYDKWVIIEKDGLFKKWHSWIEYRLAFQGAMIDINLLELPHYQMDWMINHLDKLRDTYESMTLMSPDGQKSPDAAKGTRVVFADLVTR